VAIHDVVGDVELAAGVPVGELRALAGIADLVVRLVELDPEVVDQFIPEPVDAALGFPLEFGRRPSDEEVVVVVDPVRLHELGDVGRFNELLARFVSDLVDILETWAGVSGHCYS